MAQTMHVEIDGRIADSIEVSDGTVVPISGDTFRFEGKDYPVIDRVIQTTHSDNIIMLVCGDGKPARPDAEAQVRYKAVDCLWGRQQGRKFRDDEEE